MLNRKIQLGLTVVCALFGMLATVKSARANCADSIASLELVRTPMERHWQKIQQQTTYPWGKARPFGKIEQGVITLTDDFETLTGKQKLLVLSELKLGYNDNWFNLLTKEEQEAALKNPGIGAMSPYSVFASDGRALSLAYNGCDRFTLFTEAARYSQYHSTERKPEELRNAGKPSWRKVNFPISLSQEKKVRLQFWRTVGYNNKDGLYWIAWVPERGYFEINVKSEVGDRYKKRLGKFYQAVGSQYRYAVVDSEGTLLSKSK